MFNRNICEINIWKYDNLLRDLSLKMVIQCWTKDVNNLHVSVTALWSVSGEMTLFKGQWKYFRSFFQLTKTKPRWLYDIHLPSVSVSTSAPSWKFLEQVLYLSSCPIFNQTCMGDASGPIYGVNRLMLNLGYEFQM